MGDDDASLPTRASVVGILNKSFEKKRNPSVDTLSGGTGGQIVGLDENAQTLTMVFKGTDAMCNGKPG